MNIHLENRQIAVLVALVLALVMLFLPGSSSTKYAFDPETVAQAINEKEDQISPEELSQWIIEGQEVFDIIDIRPEVDFARGNIKGSINIPLKKLLLRETIDTELSDEGTTVIYSNGNSHGHQAWLVLKAAGKDALVLEGGFNGWTTRILNPQPPQTPSDDEILRYSIDRKSVV